MANTGFCLWFTGLSGSGKSTIAAAVSDELRRRGHRVELLDGDEVRDNLSAGLGFSKADRDTNIRRIGWVAALLARNGVVRDEVRATIDRFVEVYVDTPIEVCEERDVKGLYERARTGEIPEFTGVSDPYEPPTAPEVRVVTHDRDASASAAQVIEYLEGVGLTGPAPRAEAAEARS